MTSAKLLMVCAVALGTNLTATATPARAYDNDEQALRIRDTVADPSVPLAWDRRDRPETWRSRFDGYERGIPRCGRHSRWDGDECVRLRRH